VWYVACDPDPSISFQRRGDCARRLTIAESSMFWDTLIQLIEESKVVPVVGRDLLSITDAAVRSFSTRTLQSNSPSILV
jgi:hypothetical protein